MRPRSGASWALALIVSTSACAKRESPRRDGEHDIPVAAASASPLTASPPVAGPSAPRGESASPQTLRVVTAGELRAIVRASGKKGALVNAWASWCGPCRREIPMLQNLAPNLRASRIDVLLVSVDEPADIDKAVAFLRDHHVTLPSYVAARPLGDFKQGMNPRWPGMLPASFLFDGNGDLRYYFGGEAFEEELVPVLDAFAAGRPIEGEAEFLVAPEAPSP